MSKMNVGLGFLPARYASTRRNKKVNNTHEHAIIAKYFSMEPKQLFRQREN